MPLSNRKRSPRLGPSVVHQGLLMIILVSYSVKAYAMDWSLVALDSSTIHAHGAAVNYNRKVGYNASLVYSPEDVSIADDIMKTGSEGNRRLQADRKGDMGDYQDWWLQQVQERCVDRGFTNPLDFMDLMPNRDANAIQYANGVVLPLGDTLRSYFVGDKTLSQTSFDLLVIFYIMLAFALLLSILFCISCCSFAKGFRQSVATFCKSRICRDRPRNKFEEIPRSTMMLTAFGFVVLLVGCSMVFIYLILIFAISYNQGVATFDCSVARGTYEMVFGLAFSREKQYWDLWKGTQHTYEMSLEAMETTLDNRDTFLNSITEANAALRNFYTGDIGIMEGDLATLGTLGWSSYTLNQWQLSLSATRGFHSSLYRDISQRKYDAVMRRLNSAMGPPYEHADYVLLDHAKNINDAVLLVSQSAEQTAASMSTIFYGLVHDVNLSTVGLALSYTFVAVAFITLIAPIILSLILLCLLRVHIKRTEIPQWIVNAAGCNWIAYACFAIFVMLAGGVLLSVVAITADTCTFIDTKLFLNNEYKSYPRMQSIIKPNINVTTECLAATSRGRWTEAMNLGGLDEYIGDTANVMSSSLSEFTSNYLNTAEIDELFESYTSMSWMYLIDKSKVQDAGETERLSVYPEVLNSGVQWGNIPEALNQTLIQEYAPNSSVDTSIIGETLYGLKWIEDKINELAVKYASPTGFTKWCISQNPSGCDTSTQIITGNLDVRTDFRVIAVYGFILSASPNEATLWVNTVWWAAKKCRILEASNYPCRLLNSSALPQLCSFSDFSPFMDLVTSPEAAALVSNIIGQTKKSSQTVSDFQSTIEARTQRWTNQVIPYCKAQSEILYVLGDQQCKLGLFDFIYVMTGEYCTYANPYLAFAALFFCCLIGTGVIGWISTYKLWHYLYDRVRESRQLVKSNDVFKEAQARKVVESQPYVFASDAIADIMQEMADNEIN